MNVQNLKIRLSADTESYWRVDSDNYIYADGDVNSASVFAVESIDSGRTLSYNGDYVFIDLSLVRMKVGGPDMQYSSAFSQIGLNQQAPGAFVLLSSIGFNFVDAGNSIDRVLSPSLRVEPDSTLIEAAQNVPETALFVAESV